MTKTQEEQVDTSTEENINSDANTENTETENTKTTETQEEDTPENIEPIIDESIDTDDPDELKERLTASLHDSRDYLDKLKRLKAEYTNYQNRISKDRARWGEQAIQNFAQDVFGVLDNFSLAIDSVKEITIPDELSNYVTGVEMTQTQLLDILKKYNVEEIEADDVPFNPSFHEALTMIDGDKPNHVMQVVRAGYRVGDRVIRPAQVIVSKPAPKEEAKAQDEVTPDTDADNKGEK